MSGHRGKRPGVLAVALALGAILALAAPVAAAPADGNGNKLVVHIDFEGIEVECGSETIWLDATGWFQGREFGGKNNRQLDLFVFHFVLTYYNDAGETFRYLDVGPDRAYLDRDGNVIVTITGRPANAGDMGFSLLGHMVINLDTGEARWHGRTGPTADEQACAALAG